MKPKLGYEEYKKLYAQFCEKWGEDWYREVEEWWYELEEVYEIEDDVVEAIVEEALEL